MKESFIKRGSGGTFLKVVCRAEKPRQRAENTVWVKTDTPKGRIIVQPTVPLTRPDGKPLQEGDIWIATTSLDYDIFPRVKGARLGSVFQYTDSRWQPKKSCIYQDDWREFGSAIGDKRFVVPEWTDPDNNFNLLFTDLYIGNNTTGGAVDVSKFLGKALFTYNTRSRASFSGSVTGNSDANVMGPPGGRSNWDFLQLSNNNVTEFRIHNYVNYGDIFSYALVNISSPNIYDYSIDYDVIQQGSGTQVQRNMQMFIIDFKKEGVPPGTPVWCSGYNGAFNGFRFFFPTLNREGNKDNVKFYYMGGGGSINLQELTDFSYGAIVFSTVMSGANINGCRITKLKIRPTIQA